MGRSTTSIDCLLREKYAVKQVVLSPLPPMHLFPALPQPLRRYLGLRASAFNSRLAELAERIDHCTLLTTLLAPVNGSMARDGFHPGPAIYSQWADDVAAVIDQRFRKIMPLDIAQPTIKIQE